MEDNFSTDRVRGWFQDDSSTFIVHFISIIITSASVHQALDPRDWGPLL